MIFKTNKMIVHVEKVSYEDFCSIRDWLIDNAGQVYLMSEYIKHRNLMRIVLDRVKQLEKVNIDAYKFLEPYTTKEVVYDLEENIQGLMNI